jgi:hypothetical protein
LGAEPGRAQLDEAAAAAAEAAEAAEDGELSKEEEDEAAGVCRGRGMDRVRAMSKSA